MWHLYIFLILSDKDLCWFTFKPDCLYVIAKVILDLPAEFNMAYWFHGIFKTELII